MYTEPEQLEDRKERALIEEVHTIPITDLDTKIAFSDQIAKSLRNLNYLSEDQIKEIANAVQLSHSTLLSQEIYLIIWPGRYNNIAEHNIEVGSDIISDIKNVTVNGKKGPLGVCSPLFTGWDGLSGCGILLEVSK